MQNNEKGEKFRRLAIKRTNIILNKIRILSNCSNRSAYEYTEDEVEKIFSSIEKALKEGRSKFHFPKKKEFKF